MSSRNVVAGRTAVITGAGSGIGRALAQHLSAMGCPVAACDWEEDGLEETIASLPGQSLHRKLDVRDRQAQLTWAADVAAWAPSPIGVVINNAGVTVSNSVTGGSPEDDEWVMDVNFWGVVNGTRAFLPILQQQDSGVVVNVSSLFGIIAWPTQSAYNASKFAVRGFTESLRIELEGTGVSAITVHPGGVATHIVDNARFHVDDQGGTDHTKLQRDFNKVARTTPKKAAQIIVTGVERGKDRILVGPDAVAMVTLSRILPNSYFDVIRKLMPLVRR
ncbi:SDR family NAD(P)-dependent oxidoreductase [Patulibacter sp. NPDC049589]|uniref:SDR family NAD(P)-dependent oxidoreductase n=1 Tax=Patulibacter sp. NPDC049589 TaxID=3154731 RepID=UPI0034304AEE